MSANLRGVLFDLDGTLVDTALDFRRIINKMLQQAGKPAVDYPHWRPMASQGAKAMVSSAFDLAQQDPQLTPLIEQFLAHYAADPACDSQLFDGADRLLERLKAEGIPWGIVTNKPLRFAEPLLQSLGLDKDCAVLICPDHVTNPKPDPEALLLACKQLQLAPEQCCYLGDHLRDIEAGKRAGMLTIGCAYGYLSEPKEAQSWAADFVVETAQQLTELFELRLL